MLSPSTTAVISELAKAQLPPAPEPEAAPERPVPLTPRERQLLDLQDTLKDEALRETTATVLKPPGAEEGSVSFYTWAGGPQGHTGRFNNPNTVATEEVREAFIEALAIEHAVETGDHDPNEKRGFAATNKYKYDEIVEKHREAAETAYEELREQFDARYQEITKADPSVTDYSFEQYIIDVATYDENALLTTTGENSELDIRMGRSTYGNGRNHWNQVSGNPGENIPLPQAAYFGHGAFPANMSQFKGGTYIIPQNLDTAVSNFEAKHAARLSERDSGVMINGEVHAPEGYVEGAVIVSVANAKISDLVNHNKLKDLGTFAIEQGTQITNELTAGQVSNMSLINSSIKLLLTSDQQEKILAAVPGSEDLETAIESLLQVEPVETPKLVEVDLSADEIASLVSHPELTDIGLSIPQEGEKLVLTEEQQEVIVNKVLNSPKDYEQKRTQYLNESIGILLLDSAGDAAMEIVEGKRITVTEVASPESKQPHVSIVEFRPDQTIDPVDVVNPPSSIVVALGGLETNVTPDILANKKASEINALYVEGGQVDPLTGEINPTTLAELQKQFGIIKEEYAGDFEKFEEEFTTKIQGLFTDNHKLSPLVALNIADQLFGPDINRWSEAINKNDENFVTIVDKAREKFGNDFVAIANNYDGNIINDYAAATNAESKEIVARTLFPTVQRSVNALREDFNQTGPLSESDLVASGVRLYQSLADFGPALALVYDATSTDTSDTLKSHIGGEIFYPNKLLEEGYSNTLAANRLEELDRRIRDPEDGGNLQNLQREKFWVVSSIPAGSLESPSITDAEKTTITNSITAVSATHPRLTGSIRAK